MRGRKNATSTQKNPRPWNQTCDPRGFDFFCANNWTVLFNISAAGSCRGLQTVADPDGSNGSWRPPPHKRPPLNWWIVFQVITHYHSNSFCWSRSRRIRHGGLGVTQSAELLFKRSWCLLDPPSEIGCTEKRKRPKQTLKNLSLLFFFRCFHVNSLVWRQDIRLSSSIRISPREKNNSDGAKVKSAWCPESIQFVAS